ncbi:hypothetical protein [Micromonospora andamanensis]|uniref:hypothetical protein n=1 Tax=Micromonospora andamanensis TaxID=1287068 RepID=UPI001952358A|nr:hypothetical protein [Micromonospora andamanensis]GIJ42689.1 hypothetical protein Vwe01_60140 [Micromonospora andamanensis]
MGSDWIWELRVPAAESAVCEMYALAADRGLNLQRPDGLINLFTKPDGDAHTVEDPQTALDAIATGTASGQFWTNDDVDVFVEWRAGTLIWALDAVFCHRRAAPEADAFRELHARLTALWLDAAERLHANLGRILDEWSSEQIWHLDIHHSYHPAGGWPAELGWWTYLAPDRRLPPAPLPEITAQARQLPNGALLVELLDDPAAVDPLRYQDIHTRWLQAP